MKIIDFMYDTISLLETYRVLVPLPVIGSELMDFLMEIEDHTSREQLYQMFGFYQNVEVSEYSVMPFVNFLETRWNFVKRYYPLHYSDSYHRLYTQILESLATNLAKITYGGQYRHRYSFMMPSANLFDVSLAMDLVGVDSEIEEKAMMASYLEAGVNISALQNRGRHLRAVSLDEVEIAALEQLTEEQFRDAQACGQAKTQREITQLRDFILDENLNMINVHDCIKDAFQDDILKHTNLYDNHAKALHLNPSQVARVLAHSTEAHNFYEATHRLNDAKRNSNSVGGHLHRLIQLLRMSGEHGPDDFRGTETDAGSIAFGAVEEFHFFLHGLSEADYNTLMNTNAQYGLTKSFNYVWCRLIVASLGHANLDMSVEDITNIQAYLLYCENESQAIAPAEDEDESEYYDDEELDYFDVEESVANDVVLPGASETLQPVSAEAVSMPDEDQIRLYLPADTICVEMCANEMDSILYDNFHLYNIFPNGHNISEEENLLQTLDDYNAAQQKMRDARANNSFRHFTGNGLTNSLNYSLYSWESCDLKGFFYGLMESGNKFENAILKIPANFYSYLFSQILDNDIFSRYLVLNDQLKYLLEGLNFYLEPSKSDIHLTILNALGSYHLRRLITHHEHLYCYINILSPQLYLKLCSEYLGYNHVNRLLAPLLQPIQFYPLPIVSPFSMFRPAVTTAPVAANEQVDDFSDLIIRGVGYSYH